ncbi:hypothetical protein OSTOST_24082, partial [Ostertagia ostertagi]
KTCCEAVPSLKVDRTQRGREERSDRDDRDEERELAETNFFKEDPSKDNEKQAPVATSENAVGKKLYSPRQRSSSIKKTKSAKSRKKKSVKVRSGKSKKSKRSMGPRRDERKDVRKGMEMYKNIYEGSLVAPKSQQQQGTTKSVSKQQQGTT